MPSDYSDDYRINWYRSPIDKAHLGQLMKRSNLRGWLQTIAHLGLFVTTGVLAYVAYLNVVPANWPWSLPLLLVALFLHGTMGPFPGLIAGGASCASELGADLVDRTHADSPGVRVQWLLVWRCRVHLRYVLLQLAWIRMWTAATLWNEP